MLVPQAACWTMGHRLNFGRKVTEWAHVLLPSRVVAQALSLWVLDNSRVDLRHNTTTYRS
jgi:hypothetical protein